MSQSTGEKKIYFEYLDVIRFIAAFMIVIVHAYEALAGWDNQIISLPGGKFIDNFLRNLTVGVNVFFLISGFLITYILLEEKKRYKTIYIKKFIIRRTLRIWPLYYFLIAIAPLLIFWLGEKTHPNYWANSLFFGNIDIIKTEKWIFPFAHFWSICIEEYFYLVWPFIILFIPRKHLLTTFSLIIFGTILFRIYTSYTMQYPWYTIYLHNFSKVDTLVIGAIGAYFYSHKPFHFKLTKSVRILLFMSLIISMMISHIMSWESLFAAGFKKYFYISIIAVLLLDYNFNPKFKHLLKKKSPIHYLGKVSYGIYMYGNILLPILLQKVIWPFHIQNIWLFFLIISVVSIIVPIISYELFEKQLLKLSKRFRVIETER